MDRSADLAAEHVVNEPVLLDARKAGEAVRDDLGAEVVATTRQILYIRLCAGQRCLDPLL